MVDSENVGKGEIQDERPNRFIFNLSCNLVWNLVRDFARNLNFCRKNESLRFYFLMPNFRPNTHLPPFPARTLHALLPLCPIMESPCSTPPAPKNYIIRKSATCFHHPAISRCRERGTVKVTILPIMSWTLIWRGWGRC
jgi:hypothetical protein